MTKLDHSLRAQAFLGDVRKALTDASVAIDAAGEHATAATGDDDFNMLACFASNTLQGSLALLREMEAKLKTRRVR